MSIFQNNVLNKRSQTEYKKIYKFKSLHKVLENANSTIVVERGGVFVWGLRRQA